MTNALRSTADPQDSSKPDPSDVLRHAETDADLRACWPVMQQLRPHVAGADDFIARVHRMRADRYHLLAARHGGQDGKVLALGGYHLMENLVYGTFLYVDDLVTLDTARGQRWGERLIDAMTRIAEEAGCTSLVLDTAVSNVDAQRFYLRIGLSNKAMRFSRVLVAGAPA